MKKHSKRNGKHLFWLLTLLFLSNAVHASAEQNLPWMQLDVLKAGLAIGMNDKQSPQFKTAVSRYLNDMNSVIKKLIRRNPSGLERKIKSKQKILRKRMDADMAAFLSTEQIQKYHVYRDLLIERMLGKKPQSETIRMQNPPSHGGY